VNMGVDRKAFAGLLINAVKYYKEDTHE
jgi:hypothetical protein